MQPEQMRNAIAQPVIWMVQFKDGSTVREFDEDGTETVFTPEFLERKQDFSHIGLLDLVNGLKYAINLATGRFILNGQEFVITKELDGRVYQVSNLPGVDYRAGVIQYKASKPIEFRMGGSSQARPATFNIGYKVALPENFLAHRQGNAKVSYTHVQALISIDADVLQPALAITFTEKTEYADGQVRMRKS